MKFKGVFKVSFKEGGFGKLRFLKGWGGGGGGWGVGLGGWGGKFKEILKLKVTFILRRLRETGPLISEGGRRVGFTTAPPVKTVRTNCITYRLECGSDF